jgi:hypothetical protein
MEMGLAPVKAVAYRDSHCLPKELERDSDPLAHAPAILTACAVVNLIREPLLKLAAGRHPESGDALLAIGTQN